jgi:hypothetical protein
VQRISDRVERMAVAEQLAGYIGVERGIVLDSFRKTVADRQEMIVARPKETIRADEKGLIQVLLSDAEGRDALFAELENAAILERLRTRGIYQAIRTVNASGGVVTFDAVNARLDENDKILLAEVLLAEEPEGQELDIQYGFRCLQRLRLSDDQMRLAELKAQVKQAERAGNMAEALRLLNELARLEGLGRDPEAARA